MTDAYVVVARELVRECVYGPFESGPAASGWALNRFGASEPYAAVKWSVKPLRIPAGDAE